MQGVTRTRLCRNGRGLLPSADDNPADFRLREMFMPHQVRGCLVCTCDQTLCRVSFAWAERGFHLKQDARLSSYLRLINIPGCRSKEVAYGQHEVRRLLKPLHGRPPPRSPTPGAWCFQSAWAKRRIAHRTSTGCAPRPRRLRRVASTRASAGTEKHGCIRCNRTSIKGRGDACPPLAAVGCGNTAGARPPRGRILERVSG